MLTVLLNQWHIMGDIYYDIWYLTFTISQSSIYFRWLIWVHSMFICLCTQSTSTYHVYIYLHTYASICACIYIRRSAPFINEIICIIKKAHSFYSLCSKFKEDKKMMKLYDSKEVYKCISRTFEYSQWFCLRKVNPTTPISSDSYYPICQLLANLC